MYPALTSYNNTLHPAKRSVFDFNRQGECLGKDISVEKRHAKDSLYRNDPEKPLLERLCVCYPEFILDTLINGDLQTLLSFRTVSKELNIFVCTKRAYCNLLFNKATISILYNQLYPVIQKAIQEKYDFAQKTNLELQILTTSAFDNLFQMEEILALHNRLKIILKIENIDELNKLGSLSVQNHKHFLESLKILDFSELFIDTNNILLFNTVLATISQNLDILTSLTTIVIREVSAAVALQLPDPLNSKTIIFKLNEDKSWFTLENAAKGVVAGLSIYAIYRYWFPKESSKEEEK